MQLFCFYFVLFFLTSAQDMTEDNGTTTLDASTSKDDGSFTPIIPADAKTFIPLYENECLSKDYTNCGHFEYKPDAACTLEEPCAIFSKGVLASDACGDIYKLTHPTSGVEIYGQIIGKALKNPVSDIIGGVVGGGGTDLPKDILQISNNGIEKMCPKFCRDDIAKAHYCVGQNDSCSDSTVEDNSDANECACACYDFGFLDRIPSLPDLPEIPGIPWPMTKSFRPDQNNDCSKACTEVPDLPDGVLPDVTVPDVPKDWLPNLGVCSACISSGRVGTIVQDVLTSKSNYVVPQFVENRVLIATDGAAPLGLFVASLFLAVL